MRISTRIIRRLIVCFVFMMLHFNNFISAQEELLQNDKIESISVKGAVIDENEIRLRWSPANPKAWLDGKKYGYTVERYTMLIDNVWQKTPEKQIMVQGLKPKPLEQWESIINTSDYAAVIAQAFYGEDFELSVPSGDMASIINQAEELQQRFGTSVFMAEYDYNAAEMAAWAFTDKTIKKNEKYLYRIYIDRPDKEEGDTTAVYIGFTDKKELPKPIELNAVFGDKSVVLSWNYFLLSNTYHSYHVERMEDGDNTFRRITDIPVTLLDAEMREMYFTDSLANNESTYTYRVYGITSFDQTGPVSDTISGHGRKAVKCIPQIYAGYFTDENKAHIFWEFNCDEEDLVKNFQIEHSEFIDGDYEIISDNVPVNLRDYPLILNNDENYIKLSAINKDDTRQESFPFLIRQIDSIPPAVPAGLNAVVDSLGVAHLSWDANTEPDLRGYRLLRSFSKDGEKSSLISDYLTETYYSDSLSLTLNNSNVYYSLTAVDNRYNESDPCPHIEVVKPNIATPAEPVIIGYEINGNKVSVSWITDTFRKDIRYTLTRETEGKAESEETIFSGDFTANNYTDEVAESGDYIYKVTAYSSEGKKSISPQLFNVHVTAEDNLNQVGGFNSYVDRDNRYIELTWRKNAKAVKYRIYKSEDGGKMFLWQELDADQSRIADELVSPDTKYTYTILFISDEGRPSKTKNLIVNY